jgi:hypothetical protein
MTAVQDVLRDLKRVACSPGCRWEARVLTWGPSRNGVHYSSRLGDELVAKLQHVPIGVYRRGRRFEHRDGHLIQCAADLVNPRLVVGVVERAWADRAGLYAEFHLVEDAGWLREALRRMEHDGVLRQVGVSIVAYLADWEWRLDLQGRVIRIAWAVDYVDSVDLVTVPSAGGCLLRSINNEGDRDEH